MGRCVTPTGTMPLECLSRKTRNRTQPVGWVGFLNRSLSDGRTRQVCKLRGVVVPSFGRGDVDVVTAGSRHLPRLLERSLSGLPAVEQFAVLASRFYGESHSFFFRRPWSWAFHRLILNSVISFEYFPNMAIRLPVNSAITLRTSKGDLIVANLWLNSNASCMLACAISSSFA
jgi:hypothetical protein